MRMQINIPVSILKEGKIFVAYTPALDFSTSGKTLEQVQRRFEEAVELFFEELQRMGTVHEVLESRGIRESRMGEGEGNNLKILGMDVE